MFENLKKKLEEMDAEGSVRPRKPVVAALLSICPGLGQHYAGYLTRGIMLYIALVVVSWLAAIIFMYVDSKVGIILLAVPFVGVLLIGADAYSLAKKQPADYRRRWFNRAGIYAGVFIFLALTVNPLMDFLVGRKVLRGYFMTSNSMTQTILPRDIILINKLDKIKRGDIVLIQFGEEKKSAQLTKLMEDQIIKRIVAGPTDTIEIRGKDVIVNGYKLDEPYVSYGAGSTTMAVGSDSYRYGPKQVPSGTYFVMGDNRNVRFDSRIFGFIDKQKIVGKATKVFWSWNLEQGGIRWDRTALPLK